MPDTEKPSNADNEATGAESSNAPCAAGEPATPAAESFFNPEPLSERRARSLRRLKKIKDRGLKGIRTHMARSGKDPEVDWWCGQVEAEIALRELSHRSWEEFELGADGEFLWRLPKISDARLKALATFYHRFPGPARIPFTDAPNRRLESIMAEIARRGIEYEAPTTDNDPVMKFRARLSKLALPQLEQMKERVEKHLAERCTRLDRARFHAVRYEFHIREYPECGHFANSDEEPTQVPD